jgi:flagellar operon protein
MELRKLGLNENIATPEKSGPSKISPDLKGGPSFADTLSSLKPDSNLTKPALANAGLAANLKPQAANIDGVKFSNHAVERMMTRGISFNPQDMQRLNEAVGRAAAKGSKDSLILMNDSALIVSVKNKTVVTVMDKNALKENVFTNIDSTIVM